jgi:phosphoribosylamine--glycine ligase
MNILLIGSGGREHALAWKIRQSVRTKNLYIAPGNAGTSREGENVSIEAGDFDAITDFCRSHHIDLVVVGPEGPLVEGLRDHLEAQKDLEKMLIVGPGRQGAKLEGSKDFSKAFMLRHGIPTAIAKTFTSATLDAGLAYLETRKLPVVLKADGLAAGKGVIIAHQLDEAKKTLLDMLQNKRFGEASNQVLIEDFLDGIELSVFVLTDGEGYIILPEAKDYKRIGEQDTGPNTGGMGAVSPVPFADGSFMKKVEERIIRPTINGLRKENIPYRGFIFFGLINVKGDPMVIEYNARMGDPETEAVMTRIDSDLVDLLEAAAKGELSGKSITIDSSWAITVVMVAGGYPGEYAKGHPIAGLEGVDQALVFHAGTRSSGKHTLTNGGRVLAVTGKGATLELGRKIAYDTISGISWTDVYFRKDIGVDLLDIRGAQ